MHIFLCYVLLCLGVIFQMIASFVLLFVPRYFRSRKGIKGQKVLITGAGSGLGRQLAIEFSKHATRLALVDIDRPGMLQTQKLLDRRSTSFIYECDVSDYKKVYEMAEKVKEEAGDVDILVNNAGIVSGKYLLDLPEEKIIKTMEVNTLAHFWTCKAFLPSMMEKNSGHLISTASIFGKAGAPKLTDYCASKFAAVGFAEAIEMELREQNLDGIKVTIILPSLTDTGLFKGAELNIGPILSPEYVAKEIMLEVLEEKESIYIPRLFKYAANFKEFVPRWVLIKGIEVTGIIKGMENFTGRHPNNTQSAGKSIKTN